MARTNRCKGSASHP